MNREQCLNSAQLRFLESGNLDETLSFVSSDEVCKSHLEYISKRLKPIRSPDSEFIDQDDAPEPWYEEHIDHIYWQAYKSKLIEKFPLDEYPEVVKSISESTAAIMDRLPNPAGEPSLRHGLVIGKVQSGKTSHLTGLVSRAADAGYNLIIILSGLYNSLREQTQYRLETDLGGDNWRFLTSEDDFQANADIGWLDSSGLPRIIVAKKVVSPLQALRNWLDLDEAMMSETKMLLIDDEADSASPDKSSGGGQSSHLESDDEDSEPTVINAYIRSILSKAPHSAYIGYTATPYANIFEDPYDLDQEFNFDEYEQNEESTVSERLGPTLFPRDFITRIESFDGYLGLTDIWGKSDQEPCDIVTITNNVETEDGGREESDGKSVFDLDNQSQKSDIPASLRNALLDFLIAGALRESTNSPKHHSMMIHIEQETKLDYIIAKVVREFLDALAYEIYSDVDVQTEIINRCHEVFSHVKLDTDEILEVITEICEECAMVVLNDKSNQEFQELADLHGAHQELNYRENSGLKYHIVIGGNLLSRGLTIEGLSCSYFLREAGTYDALIQMCRWFGYRSSYLQFIRIHMSWVANEYFTFLAQAERALYLEIQRLSEENLSPVDYKLRVLKHIGVTNQVPQLKPTQSMKNVISTDTAFNRVVLQTKTFHLTNQSLLQENLQVTATFLNDLVESKNHDRNGQVYSDVAWDTVREYLQSLNFPSSGEKLNQRRSFGGLYDYVDYLNKNHDDELASWNVALIDNESGHRATHLSEFDCDIKFGLPTRTKDSDHSIGELTNDRNASSDLAGWPKEFRGESGAYPRGLMWEKRGRSEPALHVYIIDRESKANGKIKQKDLYEDPSGKCHVVGVTLIIPERKHTNEDKRHLIQYYTRKD